MQIMLTAGKGTPLLQSASHPRSRGCTSEGENAVDKKSPDTPVAGLEKGKLTAVPPRFGFLYVVIAAVAVATVMTYSGIVGLVWWQSGLMIVGAVIVGWAALFSILEVRRLAGMGEAPGDNGYPSRELVVEPPTGEAYPHHEDHAESPGYDQTQLTSRIRETTPLVDKLFNKARKSPQPTR